MRKIRLPLLALIAFALLSPGASAQYAFQDAVNIQHALKTPLAADNTFHIPPLAAYYTILQHYLPAADSTGDAIKKDFAGNPFLRIDAVVANLRDGEPPQTAFPGGIGNLDVTNIASGVAALLVDRAKQELTIAFFNRFKTLTANTDFGTLFPTTTANLGKLLSYAYPQMLPVLRNGFLSDLSALPGNIAGLLDVGPYKKFFDKYPALRVAIRSFKLISELRTGASTPAEVLYEFTQFPEVTHPPTTDTLMLNIASCVRLAGLLSQSLRSSQTGEDWVAPIDLKPLLTDPVLPTIYLGLLWQQANTDSLTFYPGSRPVSFTTLLGNIKSQALPFLDRINAFITLAGTISSAYKTIHADQTSGKTPTNAEFYNYIGSAIDAIDTAFGIVDFFLPNLNTKPYFTLARSGNAIYKDIYSQQYTQAISDGIGVLSQIGNLSPELSDLATFAEKAKPFVIFMGNLIEANSAADVQAALDNAILPVGSSSIKKNTHNNLSVQAYLGAYAITSHASPSVTGTWSDRWGVTAPIGFSYTPGFASRGSWGAVSLFLEVFDLGAIVDYDLRTDTVTNSAGTPTTAISKNYSIKLGQILSPGAYLVYGSAGNLPLALGFGGQYGPGLSSINTNGQTTVMNPSWRWSFFLTVDLPLFNIWNVTKSTQ